MGNEGHGPRRGEAAPVTHASPCLDLMYERLIYYACFGTRHHLTSQVQRASWVLPEEPPQVVLMFVLLADGEADR